MAGERWDPTTSRKVLGRLVVTGELVAQTPLHLGNGDDDGVVDLPLARDPRTGGPLLCGATTAGVLRGYLRAYERGERQAIKVTADPEQASRTVALFGGLPAYDEGLQSVLQVSDAVGALPMEATAEIRDGVRLEPTTRTAANKARFDIEVWPAGTRFTLRFLLLLSGDGVVDSALRGSLATALAGLHPRPGGITLGARSRRGYGRVAVEHWTLREYDLATRDGLLSWLASGHGSLEALYPASGVMASGSDIGDLLKGTPLNNGKDSRQAFTVRLQCRLQGSLLIGSSFATGIYRPPGVGQLQGQQEGETQDEASAGTFGPDIVSLRSRQASGGAMPVVAGTSLAGALRARCRRITNTIGTSLELVTAMFGSEAHPRPAHLVASRISVDDAVLHEGVSDLVQNRVVIDRFTGGSYPALLFDEQPVFAREQDTRAEFTLRLINPQGGEIGLLLLALKDLCLEDLPLGAESSGGRGRFRLRCMEITFPDGTLCTLEADPTGTLHPLPVRDRDKLRDYVSELHTMTRSGG